MWIVTSIVNLYHFLISHLALKQDNKLKLPLQIQTYFDADKANNVAMLADIFTETSSVEDEGQQYQGIDEIQSWWTSTKAQYQHQLEFIGVISSDINVKTRVKVTSDLAPAPIILTFEFTINESYINKLRIY